MNFQLPSTTASSGGFSFGAPNVAAAPAQQTAATKPTGFSFGASGGGDAGQKPMGFGGFGAASATPPTTAAAATVTSTASLGLGGGATANFGFGGASTAATTTAVSTGSGSTGAAPAATGGFTGFGGAVNAAATATTVAQQPTATAAPASLGTGFSFGAPTSAAAPVATAPTLQQTAVAASTAAAPTLTAATPAATVKPPATAATGGFASLNTATKTTDSSTVSNASQLSYNQLEEHINKWTLELEEQEKVFTDQATQINAWDKILISNNQKILDLNDAVQKVKSDQQTLEQELEFIATQHKELEESIVPLQKEFLKIPQVDVERSQTYLMVENLDTQLKQMSEDLKEIIDNLNESNKCQDNTDPIIQIGKILNAHMSSLQWIEQSTSNIGNKLEDITKMHETFKRDSERSFRSAYYN